MYIYVFYHKTHTHNSAKKINLCKTGSTSLIITFFTASSKNSISSVII